MIDLDELEVALRAGAADAGIAPASLVVFVVDAVRPPGTTPLAYLQPAACVEPDTVLVLRAAGAERVGAFRWRGHRLALWRELPGIPGAALGPMIRHELEHARRFERSGPAFFELDATVRRAVDAAGGAGYAELPSEREANAAAGVFARTYLEPAALAELAASAECEALLGTAAAPREVVAATIAELAVRGLAAPEGVLDLLAGDGRDGVGAFAAGDLCDGRTTPHVELVAPMV